MPETLIGYARCSTDEQDLTAHQQRLTELGVAPERIYLDHGLTGTNRARPGLDQALAAVRTGDTLVVPKLDRLARSVPDARAIGDAPPRPFTHWRLRKLADYLSHPPAGASRVVIGRTRLGEPLRRHQVSFQRTRTWKETSDPDADAKLDRFEEVTRRCPDRCFRLRPVRAAVHPPLPRHLLGQTQEP
ncbi:recombinase family protein [Streptomyces sp. NPDC005408]|uniref:recombinase family protein n=1 Tax=Streptomyces sp. NPDC005408 TaxID=3155341 RepID=UPI0033B31C89